MHDLIFISLERWDEIWRRNQFLCAALAERFPDLKILFVEPPRNVSHGLKKLSLAALREPATATLPQLPNITLFRPLKLLPNSLSAGRTINQLMARWQVRRAARRLQLATPLLWINPQDAGHFAGHLGERAVIYDITDDWTQFGTPAERRLAAAQDKYLCRRADLTIVCSPGLYDSRKVRSRKIMLLPNGVHVEHYADLEKLAHSAPKFSAPVFGYTGTIHPERVDIDLLPALASAFPQGNLLLVGPNFLDESTQRQLQAHGNIHLIGPVSYAEVTRWMAKFDVCIVPHLETPFVQSLNPLKLWEYLACGKPIASTDVAGFQEYSGLCHIGSGTDGFVAACRVALDEVGDAERAAQRQQAAAAHSWDKRLGELIPALEAL